MVKTVEIPNEFRGLFTDNWREAGVYGGRFSLKSHTVARYLLIMARQNKLRVACFREFQNSIAESSHQLLSELIDKYELVDFDVTNNAIVNTVNGSDFLFKGLWNNEQSIKSIEGIDIAWCFPAGTLVDGCPIEDLRAGDYVYCFNHKTNKIEKRKVVRLMKRNIPDNIYVLTSYGLPDTIATGEHPFYVKGKGYIPVSQIQPNDIIYASKIKSTGISSLFGWLRRNDKNRYSRKTTKVCDKWWSVLFGLCQKTTVRKNEEEQSYGQSCNERKNEKEIKGNWSQAESVGRQWERIYNRTKSFVRKTWSWVVEGISSPNTKRISERQLSNKLQIRFSKCFLYVGDRVRRLCSSWRNCEKGRQKERYILEECRVDSIKIQEQTYLKQLGLSDGGDFVYNIEVEVNNNYFANGILVHNCEEAQTISTKSLEVLTPTVRKENSKIIYTYNRLMEDDPVHNRLVVEGRPNTLIINVNYDIAQKYGMLPNVILEEIEDDKIKRPALYRHKWLGEPYTLDKRIYTDWQIVDTIPHEARLERRGLDFGYAQDSAVLVDIYYYNGGFIIDELFYQKGLSNKAIADFILATEKPSVLTVADSAEPKSIDEIRAYGVNIIGATKGQGSVNQGIQFVQNQKISITKRSLGTIKGYRNYLWKIDKDGKTLPIPDDTIHEWSNPMDSVRYALSSYQPKTTDFKSYKASYQNYIKTLQ